MRTVLAIAVVLAGCSKKPAGDECQQVVDKTFKIVSDMAKTAGKPLGDEDKAKFVEKCRGALKEGHRDPVMDCVLKANDEVQVRACMGEAMHGFSAKSQAIEGKLMMKRLERNLKAQVVETSAYPTGKAGPTPAAACCSQPAQKCANKPEDWADPVWKSLEFSVDEPGRFQYSYQSDGKTVTATAVGDPQCDGKTVTFTLTGSIENGQPKLEVAEK